jgi:uncharacterized protein YndB with AHSA1/START domain
MTDVGPDSDEVVVEVVVQAPASLVFRMFTEAELLVRWIGIAATVEPERGGLFRFELLPGEFCSGRYVEVVPPRRVVFTWGWESGALPVSPGSTTVQVDLMEHDGATAVRLTHRGLDAAMRPMHAEGWVRYLARLAATAEGRPPVPDPALPYADGRSPYDPVHPTDQTDSKRGA